MPRPKKDGAGPPKTRSRFGCWPCKARKVKCGEEKPICKNCQRQGETCDYSIRLNWAGRSRTKSDDFINSAQSLPNTPGSSTIVFPSPEVFSGTVTPKINTPLPGTSPKPASRHVRARSTMGTTPSEGWNVDPVLFNDDMKQPSQTSNFLVPPNNNGMSNSNRQVEIGANSDIPGAQYLRSPWQFPPTSMSFSGSNMQGGMMDSMQGAPSPLFPATGASIESLQISSQNQQHSDGYVTSADRSKRLRMDTSIGDGSGGVPLVAYEAPSDSQVTSSPTMMSKSPGHRFLAAPGQFPDTPHTTASSASDDPNSRIFWKTSSQRFSPDDGRRGSVPVSSLLIDTPPEHQDAVGQRRINVKESISTFFGYDRGNPDLDVDLNDDSNAIVGSPAIQSSTMVDGASIGQTVAMAFEPGGYYARPVPIKIPKLLLPLPDQLLNNHMNLLYFHHFLNHTARILVPLDCPINPYRSVLPRSKL
jgi:hypothetical protein